MTSFEEFNSMLNNTHEVEDKTISDSVEQLSLEISTVELLRIGAFFESMYSSMLTGDLDSALNNFQEIRTSTSHIGDSNFNTTMDEVGMALEDRSVVSVDSAARRVRLFKEAIDQHNKNIKNK